MKKLLFILVFILAFSCDTNESCNPKCGENSTCVDKHCCENKENATTKGYKNNKCIYECNNGFKACKKEAETYNCSNVDLKNDDFDCIDIQDIKTCLNGRSCRLPDKDSEAYKNLNEEQFKEYIEKSFEVKCEAKIIENNGKIEDQSSCTYACKLGYQDCNGDLSLLFQSLEDDKKIDGCEIELDKLHLKKCKLCEDGFCNTDGNWKNGCEQEKTSDLHLNSCEGCLNGWCNTDGDWSNGCEQDITNSDLHLNTCESCLNGWCNTDGDWSNGCEQNRKKPELHLAACNECDLGYVNNDGDWSTGCVKEEDHSSNPKSCGTYKKDCYQKLKDELGEKSKLYNATCINGYCGQKCNFENAKLCNGDCCPKNVACRSAGGCGCEYGTTRGKCETKNVNGWMIGYIEKCDSDGYSGSGDYKLRPCPHNATCNGDKCGKCLDKKLRCLDEHTIQQCQNDDWVTVGDQCVDCYVAPCPRDTSYD